MDKRSTLVYGLHTDFVKNRRWIEENFNVKGYYDADESRLPNENGIKNSEIKEKIKDFELILVCADPVSIVMDLKEEFNIPIERVKILFYELVKYANIQMSFNGSMTEDAVLMLILSKIGIELDKVSYLEIGTNDPVRFNNTYIMYQMGARGYLVDPIPSVGDLIKISRPEDKFVNAAVSDRSGDDMTFYFCKSSTVSSLVEEHHKKWDGQSHNSTREITVPIIGINELLEQMNAIPTMLLVDAEGFDDIIVKGIDFSRFSPAIIMTEVAHMEVDCREFDQFMEKNGYFPFSQVDANRFYVRKGLIK